MARPIKLTDEYIATAVKEFSDSLVKARMADGKLSYIKNFNYKEEMKAKVLFMPMAYAKMIRLIMDFTMEVGWYGCGKRIDESTYLITDILVYPQSVTGTLVDMDPAECSQWLFENRDDERFEHFIMQGHSHVNFSTSPSTTDLEHQSTILARVKDDSFYIFMIWNKRLEHNTKIYDLATNTLYEDGDITYGLYDSDCDLDEFMTEAKKMVKTYTYSYYNQKSPTTTPASTTHHTAQKLPAATNESERKFASIPKEQGKYGSGYQGRGSEDLEYFDFSELQ